MKDFLPPEQRWRFVASLFGGSWTGESWTGAYLAMFAHLKWWLVFAGLVVLAMVITLERLVWRMVRKLFASA
jgi:hypothetical protein